MSDTPDLQLYQRSGENTGGNHFMLDISSSWFIQAVLSACWMLQRFIDPDSKFYVVPSDNYGEGFEDETHAFLNANFLGANARSSFGMARTAWHGLILIKAYVEWRNHTHNSTWIVCEDHTTHQIVYNTLALLHNYNTRCIEDAHRKNDRHYGSALSYQRMSPMKGVEYWPSTFKHIVPMPNLLEWPCERKDYIKNDPFKHDPFAKESA
jgi:hypothetical protein